MIYKTVVTTLAIVFLVIAGLAVMKQNTGSGAKTVGLCFGLILCAAVLGMWL